MFRASLSILLLFICLSMQLPSTNGLFFGECPGQNPCGMTLRVIKKYTMCTRRGKQVCVPFPRFRFIRGMKCNACSVGEGAATQTDFDIQYKWQDGGTAADVFTTEMANQLETTTKKFVADYIFTGSAFNGKVSGHELALSRRTGQLDPDRDGFDDFITIWDLTVAADGNDPISNKDIEDVFTDVFNANKTEYFASLKAGVDTFFDEVKSMEVLFG